MRNYVSYSSVRAAHLTGWRKVCEHKCVCAQMRLLACVNLCSVADEAKQVFITMLPWLDSDQTRWHYCLSFFFAFDKGITFLGVDQSV